MIYLDNAATTKVSKGVLEAMLPLFSEKYANPSSAHSKGEEAKEAIENARKIIAKKLNADPEEIIFTSCGSESNALAIKGCLAMTQKNKVITTKIEHPSVLENIKLFEKKDYNVVYLDVDEEGFVDKEQLKKELTNDTALVSIIHANNEIGTIQDIETIAIWCKEKNIPFHTDAVQSFCKVNIDVKKIPVTFMSISAHKIHGPKGIGALFIRKNTKVEPQIIGGEQEFYLRAGTENVPGIVGFGKAVEEYKEQDIKKMQVLRDNLAASLLKIPETKLNGPKNRLCNNINISFKHIDGSQLLAELDKEHIHLSMGSACSSYKLDPSHVLLAIGCTADEALGTIRFSLSKYTTEEEIKITAEKTRQIVEKLRKAR
ncbi:cysteine desulfurase [Candidatus Woesearchaeota archaeon]|nr:cysteine desulfurase [Candidatus Woesearchaeota archaeon]